MTTLEIELYNLQAQIWPSSGKHIMAQYDDDSIVVYQAFNDSIADYAILAIEMSLEGFASILSGCVPSSFRASSYKEERDWKAALQTSSLRLQWDPDHDLQGRKLARKAIQLGISGETLVKRYSNEWILSIEDITEFVKEQYSFVKDGKLEMVWTPKERTFEVKDEHIRRNLGMDLDENPE
ncbi:3369_t:CDS:2 [Acaulospora colombiana]|uniref:3369_t:CDS:1 n=1 Tax=Acaulospora colombiana TaxID=27376 RepID=A0ACA9NFB5_9GLOM|nr:3369_t:CDS:2 [Acaulospora colombiana]